MLSRRFARTAQQTTQQSRTPSLHQTLWRRFASTKEPPLTGAADNAFNRERRAAKEHAAVSGEFWRKVAIYVCIPSLIIGGVNTKIHWDEHWEHWATLPPLEERVEYSYQNIRNKPFPWGDGDKTLFWNDKVNYHRKDK